MSQKIRVLIVDDSAVVRQTMSEILSSDPEIEVTGTANDPFAAAARLKESIPDVITLDVEMPRICGNMSAPPNTLATSSSAGIFFSRKK